MTNDGTNGSAGRFFGLTYAWTWLFWIPAALSGRAINQPPVPILIGLGGIGPTVAALVLLYRKKDEQARRDYWRRLVDVGRIGPRWYAVILLTVPFLTALAAWLDLILGGEGGHLEPRFQSNLLALLPSAAFTLFFGPLPEELGWRGYALDRLQGRFSALTASLVLGVVWAAWHIPLFFVASSYQQGLGWGTVDFWRYLSNMSFVSVLMTWVYNHTRRSILSAVLFHFMINFTGELFGLTQRAEFFQLGFWLAATVVVVWGWGPQRLARKPE